MVGLLVRELDCPDGAAKVTTANQERNSCGLSQKLSKVAFPTSESEKVKINKQAGAQRQKGLFRAHRADIESADAF